MKIDFNLNVKEREFLVELGKKPTRNEWTSQEDEFVKKWQDEIKTCQAAGLVKKSDIVITEFAVKYSLTDFGTEVQKQVIENTTVPSIMILPTDIKTWADAVSDFSQEVLKQVDEGLGKFREVIQSQMKK